MRALRAQRLDAAEGVLIRAPRRAPVLQASWSAEMRPDMQMFMEMKLIGDADRDLASTTNMLKQMVGMAQAVKDAESAEPKAPARRIAED